MSCAGHCLDVAYIVLSSPSGSLNGGEPKHEQEQDSAASVSEHTETYTYTHLKPWQTRVLRLHPSEFPSDGRKIPLSADLLIVTVPDAEDFLIECTGETIEYTALSYSWGRPMLGKTLICNGKMMPISGSNAAALVALRDLTEPTYKWIDAICINQKDAMEKSAQVARMLKIYKKAQSVAVWLGEPDAVSLLAFACIHGLSKLREEISEFGQTTHSPSCYDRMRLILGALLSLYNRPWLRRTWVRQEIYGARRLVIHCGSQQVSWDGFVGAADVMKMILALVKDEGLVSESQLTQHDRLLTEAARNASLPPTGVKPPRELTEVLLESRYFEATDTKDTFYAILGMCNVVAFNQETAQRHQDPKGTVLVDYEKSLVEVYHDATLCILHRRGNPHRLADLWHSYKRGLLHAEGLPLWAVDWRSGTREDSDRETLEKHPRSFAWPQPLTLSPSEANEQHTIPNGAGDVTRAWYWPEPLTSDPKVLCLRARVLNYVAYLTDFTCDPDQLAEENFERLGLTAWAIHSDHMLRDPLEGHVIVYPNPEWEMFNPETHSWRLAILGVGTGGQICLVPSTTQKGDLTVGIAPGLFAMVISPMRSDRTIGGLIPRDDAYEAISKEPPRRSRSCAIVVFLCHNSTLMLVPLTAAFLALWYTTDWQISGVTKLISCYHTVALFLLFGHVASLYLRAFELRASWQACLKFLPVLVPCSLGMIALARAKELRTWQPFTIAGAWVAASAVALLVGHSLRFHRQIGTHMAIASRRVDVFKSLDSVTEILGREFQFQGPVLVRGRDYRDQIGSSRAQGWLRIRFWIDSLLSFRSRDRAYLRAKYSVMRSSIGDNLSSGKPSEIAQKRPIQEFRLH